MKKLIIILSFFTIAAPAFCTLPDPNISFDQGHPPTSSGKRLLADNTNLDTQLTDTLNQKAAGAQQAKINNQVDPEPSIVNITVGHYYGEKTQKVYCRGVIVKGSQVHPKIFPYGIATHDDCLNRPDWDIKEYGLKSWNSFNNKTYRMDITAQFSDGSEKKIYHSLYLNIPRPDWDYIEDDFNLRDKSHLRTYAMLGNITVILPQAEDMPENPQVAKTAYFKYQKPEDLIKKTDGKLTFYADGINKIKKFENVSFGERSSKGRFTLKDKKQERLIGDPLFYKGMLVGVSATGEGNRLLDYGWGLFDRPLIQLLEQGDFALII